MEGRHIMKLRQQLQKQGYSRSFTTDEKGQLGQRFSSKRQQIRFFLVILDCCLSDPEEFLTVIMHHILALDPLLKLYAHNRSMSVMKR